MIRTAEQSWVLPQRACVSLELIEELYLCEADMSAYDMIARVAAAKTPRFVSRRVCCYCCAGL